MYSLLTRAEWIVGRAGYSSLMDYACLRSLVSDPQPLRFCAVHAHGHSEQGYLGQRLKRLGYADFRSENTFDLREAWLDRNRFKFAYAFPE
jgi:predicted glycosyltransferase